jgi:syntaxin 18
VLSDRDREAVDKDAKNMMRELNWSIETLDGAEKVRHETQLKALQKKYGGSLGSLGSWASGGLVGSKTPEHEAAEAQAQELRTHREGVLWYLRQRLQLCGQTQKAMMEARLKREVELNRSLASQAPTLADFAEFTGTASSSAREPEAAYGAAAAAAPGDQGLSAEQLQMFEEGNQDMMKFFESMHEQVQYVTSHFLGGHFSVWTLDADQHPPPRPERRKSRWQRCRTCSRRSSATWRRRRSTSTKW